MDGPVRYVVTASRFSEVAQWLKCNDVNPNEVPFKSDVFVEIDADGEWVIRHAVYTRSATGVISYDPVSLTFGMQWRTVPLVNDPPMWWLKDVSPPVAEAADAWLPGYNVD